MGLMDQLFGRNSKDETSVFISYRRADSAYAASAISDRLSAHFGRESVFHDVASIKIGDNFADVIWRAMRDASVVLVLIGETWTERIGSVGDFVRQEVEYAFANDKAVIPVIVGNAQMPRADELPESLQQLTHLNAVILRTGKDFSANIDRLIHAIEIHTSADAKSPVLPENIESLPPEALPTEPSSQGDSEPSKGKVFISYRRDGGAETARLIRYELLARNWRVFLDVEDLRAGKFDDILLSEVASSDSFLLILSPNALRNCMKRDDWVRREIKKALDTQRNIVPLLKENANRPDSEELPEDIEAIRGFNCVDYSHAYYNATISKLLSFLTQGNGITMT